MRTVIREHLFESLLSNVHPNTQRCDEALAAAEWAIAREPYRYPVVPGSDKRVINTRQLFDVPALLVFFTVDDEETCTLWGLEVIESTVSEANLDD